MREVIVHNIVVGNRFRIIWDALSRLRQNVTYEQIPEPKNSGSDNPSPFGYYFSNFMSIQL